MSSRKRPHIADFLFDKNKYYEKFWDLLLFFLETRFSQKQLYQFLKNWYQGKIQQLTCVTANSRHRFHLTHFWIFSTYSR